MQGRRLNAQTREQIIRLSEQLSRRMTARLLRVAVSTVFKVLRQSRLRAKSPAVQKDAGTSER